MQNITTINDLQNEILSYFGADVPSGVELLRAVESARSFWDPATGTFDPPLSWDVFEAALSEAGPAPLPSEVRAVASRYGIKTGLTEVTVWDGRMHGGGTVWDGRFMFQHGCPEREPGEALNAYGGRVATWAIEAAMASGAYADASDVELTVRVEDSDDDVTVEVRCD